MIAEMISVSEFGGSPANYWLDMLDLSEIKMWTEYPDFSHDIGFLEKINLHSLLEPIYKIIGAILQAKKT